MARYKSVQTSPITVDNMNHIHDFRVMGRTETHKERLAEARRKLVGKRHTQDNHYKNQKSLGKFGILYCKSLILFFSYVAFHSCQAFVNVRD